MTRIDGEPEPLSGRPVESSEKILWHIDDRSARLADEVAVRVTSEVVRRRTVTEMRMDDDAELLQLFKISIDRRDMHVGRPRLHRQCQILGGHMP